MRNKNVDLDLGSHWMLIENQDFQVPVLDLGFLVFGTKLKVGSWRVL
jgi:hypothetical protein